MMETNWWIYFDRKKASFEGNFYDTNKFVKSKRVGQEEGKKQLQIIQKNANWNESSKWKYGFTSETIDKNLSAFQAHQKFLKNSAVYSRNFAVQITLRTKFPKFFCVYEIQ